MDWGVLDWRDANAYPKSGDALTIRQWWWQFTRRNPEYRRLWQERQPLRQEFSERNIEWCRAMAANDGCSLEIEIEHQWSKHLFPGDLPNLREKFGLTAFLDPRADRVDDLKLRSFQHTEGAPAHVAYFNIRALEKDQDDENFYLLRFDLKRPIPEQLEAAGKHLIEMQRHASGKAVKWHRDTDKWPLFLRALDARDTSEKATFEEMAATFWPKEEPSAQKARDTFNAAHKLRNYFQY